MNLEKIVGKNFQDTFETCKRSFISAFSICMTVLSNCCTLCNFDFALALAEKKNWTGSNIIFVSVNSLCLYDRRVVGTLMHWRQIIAGY